MVTSLSSALEITEVEQNPSGADKNNEWVELYSNDKIDLDGYYLMNKAEKRFNLTGEFTGYIAITITTISSGWITNTGDTISLWRDGEKIDETNLLKDEDDKKDLSESKCSGEWVLLTPTKGEENACDDDEETDSEDDTNSNDEETSENDKTSDNSEEESNSDEDVDDTEDEDVEIQAIDLSNNDRAVKSVSTIKSKIVLNSEEVKENVVSREGNVQNYVIYGFTGFCILLIILLALKKL